MKAMQYELEPVKKVSKETSRRVVNKAYKNAVGEHSSLYTLGLLALKHKVGILMAGNIVLIMNFILPEWFRLALGLIGK